MVQKLMLAERRRSRLLIIYEMLESVSKGRIPKTTIMYRARLNFSQMQQYLNLLLERGLIKEVREGERTTYEITEQGKIFLDAYRTIEQVITKKEK